jgi:hypothetical protein
MFDIKINEAKNAILCVLIGQFDYAEAERYVEKFKEGVNKLKPGYAVISDLRDFSPAKEDARKVLQEAIEYSVAKGRGRVIRILNDSLGATVGNIQLNKASRKMGYEVEVVSTLAEAEEKLGW